MSARRYVVQKVGDSYVPVLQDSHPRATRAAASIWGGILTLIGLRRGGCTGTALLAGGAWLLYCGATGKVGECCGGFLNFSRLHRDRQGKPGQTPSYQNDDTSRAAQLPADPVDEAVMESFPASDPPATMGTVMPH